ncbi:MAG TPA: molybdopterin cofactor-binding domain-containing protein [Stellaceae bacterium]|nr:molybdopterin cofactor-binding domain-containing protein [Stellaceae bacterium]
MVDVVADKAEWGKTLAPGHGQGIAVHRCFLSYVATVVEVAVDAKGKLTVPRVDTAIDCGFAANPERIYSQVEGAATMGLSLAKYGEISFKNGRVVQNNFDVFKVIRVGEAPQITLNATALALRHSAGQVGAVASDRGSAPPRPEESAGCAATLEHSRRSHLIGIISIAFRSNAILTPIGQMPSFKSTDCNIQLIQFDLGCIRTTQL